MAGQTYNYNSNGCLSGDGTWTFTYDTENHLTAATKTGTSVSYLYDPLHRQTQKTVGTVKSRYLYSGWQRIADYDGSTGALLTRYIFGAELDEPLLQITSSGTITFLHSDAVGSVIGVTTNTGAVSNKNTYGAFGDLFNRLAPHLVIQGNALTAIPACFYFKHRYHASLGRFLQPDPIGYSDGLSLYEYATNDPMLMHDPLGLSSDNNNFILIKGGVAAGNNDLSGTGYEPTDRFTFHQYLRLADRPVAIQPEAD